MALQEGAVSRYLARLGVPRLAPATFPFDPGYDVSTVAAHLTQSAHLMAGLKLSMASWQLASEAETRRKIAAARGLGVQLVAGGAAFEVSLDRGMLGAYLDLCADMGVSCIEAGQGFTDMAATPAGVLSAAGQRGIEVQFELGRKNEGAFGAARITELVAQGQEWLDAGAVRLVIEARESARGVGLFDEDGRLDQGQADEFVRAFGLDLVCFEAPGKASQFALLDHFGPQVVLSNVRLEELLRVEIYRYGLHADAYGRPGFELPPVVDAERG